MNNSLGLLKKIVQESASASSPEKQMNYIVSAVRDAMSVSVCSLFTVDSDNGLLLAATDGLDPDSVGKVKLSVGEGLVGTIAQSSHPLNLENASKHPSYHYFPETSEEQELPLICVTLVR